MKIIKLKLQKNAALLPVIIKAITNIGIKIIYLITPFLASGADCLILFFKQSIE